MEIHATRAWKIQSRAFVRRKKVGICIVSGFQVCWSLLNIEGVPTTLFLRVDATFEKKMTERLNNASLVKMGSSGSLCGFGFQVPFEN